MKAKRERVETVSVTIEAGGGGRLPRYKQDDLAFVLQELPPLQPCSVPKFLERLGFVARPFGYPGVVYERMLAAFARGLREGKLVKHHNEWRVVGVSAPLRVA